MTVKTVYSTVKVLEFQCWMMRQIGIPYVYGAEVADPVPAVALALDCSEYIDAAGRVAKVAPRLPDGAYYQWHHCALHGRSIPVADALRISGALLFQGDLIGVGRDAVTHVAMSLGDNTTLEARSKQYRVGIFPNASSRPWSAGALIPGVVY